ncbi:MAG: RecQ family ATP-dependent DNA helicase [Verrucomicrobiaceae bacterium]
MIDDTATLADTSPRIHDARAALQQYFGFRDFLEGQERVIGGILSGRDSLVIMPTGGGKSLCYQLPAMVMNGVTVVVSPLIALMKDQVDALTRRGIPATLINSSISMDEQMQRLDWLRAGEVKLVYVAPERFRSTAFVNALRSVEIGLFAVDEAHCLSQWGHDFRPDYMRLHEVLEPLGRPQVIALTATATAEVRDDILKHLKLREPFVSISGFSRPNLSLNITHTKKQDEKYARLRSIINDHKTGIIYCATRKRVEEVTALLDEWNVSAIAYHGGMDEKGREQAQNKFISKDKDVAIATNAFGMGIDRSDVRFVAHFDVPGSIEAYYQEAGRAGRDGEPGWCELFFNFADTKTQDFFIDGSNPSYEQIRDVYQSLLNSADTSYEVQSSIEDIADRAGLKNSMCVSSALSHLARAGFIERFDIPGKRIRGTRLLQPKKLARDLKIDRVALEEKARRDRSKLKSMIEFCYADKCRQQMILEYFGEANAEVCGTCDACRGNGVVTEREGTAEEVTILRKALSGVARMSTKHADGTWEGRFGKGRVIAMLTGSKSREVLDAALDQLTTYGLLKSVGSNVLHSLFIELEKLQLIEVSLGEYPLVTLTAKGAETMRSGANVRLRWPALHEKQSPLKPGASDIGAAAQELGFDEALFDKMKRLRSALAQSEGKPAYVIFSNATLEFLTRLKPTTIEAAKKIRGIGDGKVNSYLPEFLKLIQQHGR